MTTQNQPTPDELRREHRDHVCATRLRFQRTPTPARPGPLCGACGLVPAGDWLARDGKTRVCGACASAQGNDEQPDTR